MIDNAMTQTGRVNSLQIKLERQRPGVTGIAGQVLGDSWRYYFIDVPLGATNLTICLANTSPNPLPLQIYLRRGDFPSFSAYDNTLTANPPGACLTVDTAALPPLSPGKYYLGLFNPNAVIQS